MYILVYIYIPTAVCVCVCEYMHGHLELHGSGVGLDLISVFCDCWIECVFVLIVETERESDSWVVNEWVCVRGKAAAMTDWLTDRIIGEQAGVVVEDEPPELPALHDVRPLAERALDGRHRRRWGTTGQRNTPLERTFPLRAINVYKINWTTQ